MPLSFGTLRLVKVVFTEVPCANCKVQFKPEDLCAILYSHIGAIRYSTRLHLACLPNFMYLKYEEYRVKGRKHSKSPPKRQESPDNESRRLRKSQLNRYNYLERRIVTESDPERIRMLGNELIDLNLRLNRMSNKVTRLNKDRKELLRQKLEGVGLL